MKMRLAVGFALLTTILLHPISTSVAQMPWAWAMHASQSDFDTLHPAIQRMLRNDREGTIEDWASPSGRHGHILLKRGGERAGKAVAVVRITTISGGREQHFLTFHYRKDPRRGWAVAR